MVHFDRRRPATGHRGRVRLFGRKVVAARETDCLVLSCSCVALSRREVVVGKHKLLVRNVRLGDDTWSIATI